MALGAVTQVAIDPHSESPVPVSFGSLKMTVTKVVGEASYTSGGAPITAQQLGLSYVIAAQAEVFSSTGTNATSNSMAVVLPSGGGYSANLKCFSSANAEIASTTNVSGVTWQIFAWGY